MVDARWEFSNIFTLSSLCTEVLVSLHDYKKLFLLPLGIADTLLGMNLDVLWL